LESLPLPPWTSRRRQELLELLDRFDPSIDQLSQARASVIDAAHSTVGISCPRRQPFFLAFAWTPIYAEVPARSITCLEFALLLVEGA
jgi:hypothetical protein